MPEADEPLRTHLEELETDETISHAALIWLIASASIVVVLLLLLFVL